MDFMKIGPPPLTGDENADVAEAWVDIMEQCFRVLHYDEDEKMDGFASPKRHTEFQSAEVIEIASMVATGIREADLLCRALQEKSLDILNAMDFVSTTKDLLHTLRAKGYDILLMIVQSVCENNGIEIPDMNAWYRSATGRSNQQRDSITFEHHYRFDVFNVAIDFKWKSSIADSMMEKFYPNDFNKQELHYLKSQLDHYMFDIIHHERLIRLVLTLPVSNATTERSLSAMKLLKTSLRNKMEEELLADL
ncbi:uncharacterized protein [Primulina eburnea]|uniref:uncharacterized protein n=1 Tax=Primulina eburnea TaxID=1245227 RepID=UPI003C6BFAF4